MSLDRSNIIFMGAILLACVALFGCKYEPWAYSQILVTHPSRTVTTESLAQDIEQFLFNEGFEASSPNGYSEITGIPGHIGYSSENMIVNILEEDGQIIVVVQENASNFSGVGLTFISALIKVIELALPGALINQVTN